MPVAIVSGSAAAGAADAVRPDGGRDGAHRVGQTCWPLARWISRPATTSIAVVEVLSLATRSANGSQRGFHEDLNTRIGGGDMFTSLSATSGQPSLDIG